MKYQRVSFLWVAVFSIVSFGFVQAEEAQPQVEKEVLPGNVVLHIQSGALEKSIPAIESFALKAVEGTGLPIPLQPGMAIMMMPTITKLPAGAVNLKEGVHVFLTNDGLYALALPVGDFATQVSNLKAAGIAALNEQGTVVINNPLSPGAAFMIDTGKGYVISSPSEAASKAIADTLGEWDFGKTPAKAAIVMTIDIQKLLRLNKGKVDEGFTKIKTEIQATIDKESTPAFAKEFIKLAPEYIDQLRTVSEELKSVRLYAYASKARMRLSGYFTPLAETGMQAFAKAYHGATPDYKTVRYLPNKPAMVECVHSSKDAYKLLQPFLVSLCTDFVNVVDSPSAKPFEALANTLLDQMPTNGSIAILPSKDEKSQAMISYMEIEKPEEYKENLAAMYEMLPTLLDLFIAKLPVPMPVNIKLQYKADAGMIEKVGYSTISIAIEPAEGVDKEAAAAVEAQMKPMMAMMKNFNQAYAVVDNTLVLVSGPDHKELLGEAIRALRNKTVKLGNNEVFMETLNAFNSKQIAFVAFNVLEFVRMTKLQFSAMSPYDNGKTAAAYKDLPGSSAPISMALGALRSAPKDNRPENFSLKFLVDVPAAVISESVSAIRTAEMELRGGGIAPVAHDDGQAPMQPQDEDNAF